MDPFILTKREKDWTKIETLVSYCKNQDNKDALSQDQSMILLIQAFNPFFKKYINLIKYHKINFCDTETSTFISCFIKKEYAKCDVKTKVRYFYSAIKNYSSLEEEEILSDLHFIFLKLLHRYKQIGLNFCAYLHNVFCYELSRHIMNQLKINIYHEIKEACIVDIEDNLIESNNGSELLGFDWLKGHNCNELFEPLMPIERKILASYYIDCQTEKTIAYFLGMHRNTVYKIKKNALLKLMQKANLSELEIRRNAF